MILPGTQDSMFIDKLPGLVILVGREGIVHGLNQTTIEFTGRPAEEMIGLSIGDALGCLHSMDHTTGCGVDPACETCPLFHAVLTTLETGKAGYRVEAKFAYTRAGEPTEMDLCVSTSPAILSGNEENVFVYIEDNSEHRKVNAELRDSEEKLRQMFESVVDGITVADLNGVIIEANNRVLQMHGFNSKDEVLGKSAFELIAHRDRERAMASMRSTPEQGSIEDIEYTLLKGDGSEFPGELSASVLRNAHGNPVGFIAITRDITERKRGHEEIARHTKRVETLHAIATVVSQTLDLEPMLNSALEKALEVTEVDAGYITFFDVETRVVSVKAHLGISEQLLSQIEGQVRTAEDVSRWLEHRDPAFGLHRMLSERARKKLLATAKNDGLQSFVAVPLWSKDVLHGALVLTNRTPRRFGTEDLELLKAIANQIAVGIENSKLFQKAQTQVEELKVAREYFGQIERRRALAEMAGGVAHDFNNFLAVIIGRAELALENAKDPKMRNSLQVIEQTAQDAAKMVLRLQESARAESYDEFQELDSELLVLSALQMVETRRAESQLMGRKIDIIADLGKLSPVEGKVGELRQVLINIIFNAMDALPHGGEITVKTRQENGWAVLSIIDTGAGMTEDVKARIFDPYFTTKGAAGLGLGLSASHGIVAQHGGTLEADSAPGKGSTFTIRLPIATNARGKLPGGKGSSQTHTGAKILLVDDEAEVVEVFGDMLHNLGYQVTTASSGREALDALWSERYDLLITDLHMPGISGREVANAFKQARPGMPILVITGWGLQINTSELAADAVLAKPVSKEILSREIASVLT